MVTKKGTGKSHLMSGSSRCGSPDQQRWPHLGACWKCRVLGQQTAESMWAPVMSPPASFHTMWPWPQWISQWAPRGGLQTGLLGCLWASQGLGALGPRAFLLSGPRAPHRTPNPGTCPSLGMFWHGLQTEKHTAEAPAKETKVGHGQSWGHHTSQGFLVPLSDVQGFQTPESLSH